MIRFWYTFRIPSPPLYMTSRARAILGWIPTILVAAFNTFAGISKFMTFPAGSDADIFSTNVGMKPIIHQLGVLELAIVVLFVVPRTSTVGFILMVGYMGGVLAANLTHGYTGFGDTIGIYITFAFLIWSAYFRNPELLSRLLKRQVPDKI